MTKLIDNEFKKEILKDLDKIRETLMGKPEEKRKLSDLISVHYPSSHGVLLRTLEKAIMSDLEKRIEQFFAPDYAEEKRFKEFIRKEWM